MIEPMISKGTSGSLGGVVASSPLEFPAQDGLRLV